MEARAYQPADREACLALVRHYAPAREAEFASHLNASLSVLEHDGRILGCGGIVHGAGVDELVWGMIDPAWQRRGLGRYLLLYRSKQCQAPLLDVVASAAYQAFYEKAGFRWLQPEEHGVRLRKKMAVCP